MHRLASKEVAYVVAQLILRRQEMGIPQKKVAERMQTTTNHVQDLEHGRNVPSVATLERWAHALGAKLTLDIEELKE